MKKFAFIIIVIIVIACGQGNDSNCVENDHAMSLIINDSLLKDFSMKWKNDSLGKNGFRMNHYNFLKETKPWEIEINGLSFKGYSKEKVIDILGKPNDFGFGREDGLLMLVYFIRKNTNTADKELIMYFDKQNKLHDITEKTGM
jgi:hypothetical protein